jgi:hypothetical protein
MGHPMEFAYDDPRAVTWITASLSILNNDVCMLADHPSPAEVCARLRQIGYSRSNSVKLYGEVLELLSDPYLDEDDFVVEAQSRRTSGTRVVRIPRFIVYSARAA